jgi:heptosyltransferase-2
MKPPKFLIIRFSSIGDIVLTSPVVRAIKKRFPNSEVHFLTKKQNAPIVAHNPYINRLMLLRKRRLHSLIKLLRYERYNYVIDLHHNLRTWWIKRRLHTKSVSFKKLNVRKWLLTTFKINRLPKIHIIDRYMAASKCLGIANDHQGLDFVIPPDTMLPTSFDNPQSFVALVLGAQHATKKIPYSKLLFLCQNINYRIVALGGHTEAKDGEALERECGNVRNFCGKLNIYQSAMVLQLSRLVVTPDTGLMHIAAALKKDIFSIWGNTVPDFGMYPYMAGEQSQIFEVKDLKCRPCSKIGFDACPKKHFNCMYQQDFGKLAETVSRQMAQ